MSIDLAVEICEDCEQEEDTDKCAVCAVNDLMFMLAAAPEDLVDYMPREE